MINGFGICCVLNVCVLSCYHNVTVFVQSVLNDMTRELH